MFSATIRGAIEIREGSILRLVLFILFVVVPILEIAAFIQIGSLIGLWPTLGSIVLTAVIGAFLVRQQGFKVINDARMQSARNEIPVTPVIHGVFIFAAGLLLLTPGFVTDTIGFIFLIPPFRLLIAHKAWSWIKANMDVSVLRPGPTGHSQSGPGHAGGATFDKVIEGEAIEVEDAETADNPDRPSSPWSGVNHKNG